jgi:hypothetical protein
METIAVKCVMDLPLHKSERWAMFLQKRARVLLPTSGGLGEAAEKAL